MNGYDYRCGCGRCRSRGLMGPAILITLGVLFLLHEFYSIRFQWPVLLIVIGLVKIWQSTTSLEGHGQAQYPNNPYANTGMTPPPNAGTLPPTSGDSGQVHNG